MSSKGAYWLDRILAALLALLILSCRQPILGEGDTMARFLADDGAGHLVMSEDLPTPGYANRFHFVYLSGAPAPYGPADTMVLVRAEASGVLLVRVTGWGVLRLRPYSADVRRQVSRAAPGAEDRLQRVTVQGEELLIEEEDR